MGGKTKGSWGKNTSGNPKGAPKKEYSQRAFYRAFYEEIDPEKKVPRIQAVLNSQYKQAIEKNDNVTQRHIIDQVYGKPKETVDANLSGGVNITINKVFSDE